MDTPMKKAMKFVKSLNSPVRELLLPQILAGTTYEVLVDIVLFHEGKTG